MTTSRDSWRGVQADVAVDEIDLLVVVQLEIDDAAFAEAGYEHAGFGVESDQPVAGRNVEDALVLAVSPVGQAAAGKLPRRRLAARAFDFAVHPEHLARGGIERHHRAPRSGGRIEPAVDHERGGFEHEFGPRAERVRLEAPGDFELVEVGCVDLAERGVARVSEISSVTPPLAVLRSGLGTGGRHREKADHGRNYEQSRHHTNLRMRPQSYISWCAVNNRPVWRGLARFAG